MADQEKERKSKQKVTELGKCPRCGRWLDDHDGWLTKEGPHCWKKRK